MNSTEKERLILGSIFMTSGILSGISSDPFLSAFIRRCLDRHSSGDFGLLDSEDVAVNKTAIENSFGKVVSCYLQDNCDRIWVITDYIERGLSNRTTVLFPHEY